MLFNKEKCNVVHFGSDNINAAYDLGGATLSVADVERDLGVLISSDLKVEQPCIKASKTANRVLGMISRSISNKSKDIILKLYKSLVRPHLEYCVQAWRAHYQKDID